MKGSGVRVPASASRGGPRGQPAPPEVQCWVWGSLVVCRELKQVGNFGRPLGRAVGRPDEVPILRRFESPRRLPRGGFSGGACSPEVQTCPPLARAPRNLGRPTAAGVLRACRSRSRSPRRPLRRWGSGPRCARASRRRRLPAERGPARGPAAPCSRRWRTRTRRRCGRMGTRSIAACGSAWAAGARMAAAGARVALPGRLPPPPRARARSGRARPPCVPVARRTPRARRRARATVASSSPLGWSRRARGPVRGSEPRTSVSSAGGRDAVRDATSSFELEATGRLTGRPPPVAAR